MTNLIFTSSFEIASKLDLEKYSLISIVDDFPDNWFGIVYKKLCPSESAKMCSPLEMMKCISNFPDSYSQNEIYVIHDRYSEIYKKEILRKLNPQNVLEDIRKMSNFRTPVLVSNESPKEFSHRHIVANWLLQYSDDMLQNDAGYDNDLIVREYDPCKDGTILGECSEKARVLSLVTSLVNGGLLEMDEIYSELKSGGCFSNKFKTLVDNHLDTIEKILANL